MQPMPPTPDLRFRALGLRLFGISCFAIMMVLIKLASDRGVRVPELMFWRQAAAIPIVLAWVIAGPGIGSLKTKRIGLHLTRSAMGLTAMALTFSAIMLLPLAEQTTLGFAVPIFATILSALFLKEAVGRHRWGAVVIGFIGVIIVVQPGGTHIPLIGAAVGLGSAFAVAITSLQIRSMGRTEAATTTVFWFSLIAAVPLAVLLPFFITPHDTTEWILMIAIGVLGGIGQIGITAALRLAPVSTVIVMDYSALIWSTLFGWLIWSHIPGPATWIGAAVIILSSVYIAIREHRLHIQSVREISA